jgi:hypothetical protein
VERFSDVIQDYLGGEMDKIIYNRKVPSRELLKQYLNKGESMVVVDPNLPKSRFVGANLVSRKLVVLPKADVVKRSLIRHDSDRLAKIIMSLTK